MSKPLHTSAAKHAHSQILTFLSRLINLLCTKLFSLTLFLSGRAAPSQHMETSLGLGPLDASAAEQILETPIAILIYSLFKKCSFRGRQCSSTVSTPQSHDFLAKIKEIIRRRLCPEGRFEQSLIHLRSKIQTFAENDLSPD